MRLPHVHITVRRMVVAVAAVALGPAVWYVGQVREKRYRNAAGRTPKR